MSYNYSQLNEIIKLQYAKREDTTEYDNWFLEQTIKYGKGYINAQDYLAIMTKKIIEDRNNNNNKNKIIDPPLYLDK